MITLTQTRTIKILDEKLVMESATEIGRITGRDNNWEPETLIEAIEELESIGDSSPIDNGYEVLPFETITQ